jgi:hypothetical protein
MVENPLIVTQTGKPAALTTTHTLLTSVWTADVKVLDAALRRSSASRRLNCSCHVTFFEVAGDTQLHVNVIHLHPTHTVTESMPGAAGPDGFVHGRAFDRAPRYQLLRQIRDMVFL